MPPRDSPGEVGVGTDVEEGAAGGGGQGPTLPLQFH